jgi:hypothetical protein
MVDYRNGLFGGGLMLCLSAPAANATVYTSEANLADFITGGTYATLDNFVAGDVPAPFTPTTAGLLAAGNRVYAGTLTGLGLDPTNNWISATFASPTSVIEVMPNIDHLGSAYDGYQYQIAGWNGTTWVPLFDTLTVAGAGEPFTIGSFTGTAPLLVNNVLTPSAANPNGTPGYEAIFRFSDAHSAYALGASTEAINAGNSDQEFSAVLTGGDVTTLAGGVPEPSTWAMMFLGFAGLGYAAFRRAKKQVIAALA